METCAHPTNRKHGRIAESMVLLSTATEALQMDELTCR